MPPLRRNVDAQGLPPEGEAVTTDPRLDRYTLEKAAEICENRAAEYRDGKRGAMHEHVYVALQAEETVLGLYASLHALAATLPQETVPNNTPAAPSDTPRLDRDWWRAQGIEACMDRMELMAEQQRELNALRAAAPTAQPSGETTVDIERLLDNAATSSQERELLRDDEGEKTLLREAIRLNVVELLLRYASSQPSREAVPEGYQLVRTDVCKFLRGAGPLHGIWFGEKVGTQGRYWWRKYLAAAPKEGSK